jgi:hypothetical protein
MQLTSREPNMAVALSSARDRDGIGNRSSTPTVSWTSSLASSYDVYLGTTFALSYNSQFWRPSTNGTSRLGRDIGYGFGWTLQAGSAVADADGQTYVFSDSSGAVYRLDQFLNGIYTLLEGP